VHDVCAGRDDDSAVNPRGLAGGSECSRVVGSAIPPSAIGGGPDVSLVRAAGPDPPWHLACATANQCGSAEAGQQFTALHNLSFDWVVTAP
jgi:hypothetical protein